jgi:hypothetical protein
MADLPPIHRAIAELLDGLDESDMDRPARTALLDAQKALATADTETVTRLLDHALHLLGEHPFAGPGSERADGLEGGTR